METVNCFECGEKFILEDGYDVIYNTSSLCPKCYDKAMAELFNPNAGIEAKMAQVVTLLEEIRDELRRIS